MRWATIAQAAWPMPVLASAGTSFVCTVASLVGTTGIWLAKVIVVQLGWGISLVIAVRCDGAISTRMPRSIPLAPRLNPVSGFAAVVSRLDRACRRGWMRRIDPLRNAEA